MDSRVIDKPSIQEPVPDLLPAVAQTIATTRYFPESTYRLQFHAGFTFRDALQIVPYLHAAWVRSQVTWPLDRAGVKPAKTGLLTPREQQILQWIYHGKSNIEIGMILDISPLTVKNHVQKTLRKLNVLNRTQAVGKALALRIVNP